MKNTRDCVCCGFKANEYYDGRIGAICPRCKWEVDYLEDDWSGANGSTLQDWIKNYRSGK